MAIRSIILLVFVLLIMGTAIRRWYLAACGMLLLTVVAQHPSMPTSMFNVQGVNPWNLCLVVVMGAWWHHRRFEYRGQSATRPMAVLTFAYVIMVLIAAIAAALDRGGHGPVTKYAIIDGLINPLKFVMLAYLFYDGATTPERVRLALITSIFSSMCYAMLMLKSMNVRVFTIDYEDARRMTDKLVGLFANDLAALLAAGLWAALFVYVLLDRRAFRIGWLMLLGAAIPPFVALKSRAGFLAFCTVGAVLGVLRYRRILVVMPVVLLLVVALVPSVSNRVLSGVEEEAYDWNEISAGRVTNLWPPVLEQISNAPLLGHGRWGIQRTDCYEEIKALEGHVPKHPHNSYLEILLDAGVVGLAICLGLIAVIAHASLFLIKPHHPQLIIMTGMISLIFVITELVVGIAGSSFFMTQSKVPFLCVWAVALRAYVECRSASRIAATRQVARAPMRGMRGAVGTP